MIGYKAFERDMKRCDFQFKENEEFVHKGYFDVRERGFHFYRELGDCLFYCYENDCIIHRVEVPDYVKKFNDELMDEWVTNRIRILDRVYDSHDNDEPLSEDEAQELLNSDNWDDRSLVAENGLHLDDLYLDPDKYVRSAVAQQGSHLDELYKDPSWLVRLKVAQQGAHLDELYKDPYWTVRLEVADQGSHLDELYKDPNLFVRFHVALQGVHLDELYLDPFEKVREFAACQGVHLDELYNDPSEIVRNAVKRCKKIEPYIIK